ncbi:MAG: DUF4037 domain-containing protein [Actinopolymorphaceae bacterium]
MATGNTAHCFEVRPPELGSRIIAVRLVRELMRLAFLLERTYWPYTKWFGTAFAELPIAATLTPALTAASTAATHAGREEGLVAAYELWPAATTSSVSMPPATRRSLPTPPRGRTGLSTAAHSWRRASRQSLIPGYAGSGWLVPSSVHVIISHGIQHVRRGEIDTLPSISGRPCSSKVLITALSKRVSESCAASTPWNTAGSWWVVESGLVRCSTVSSAVPRPCLDCPGRCEPR